MSHSYTSARLVANVSLIAGWTMIAGGILLPLISQHRVDAVVTALAIGLAVAIGLLLLAAGQITHAILDTAQNSAATAENTRQSLDLHRRAATAVPAPAPAAPAAPVSGAEPPSTPARRLPSGERYGNYWLAYTVTGGVNVGDRHFTSIAAARDWIDSNA